MTLRLAKILMVAAIGFFYALVVLNNLTDYDSNYQFVHHVLLMDTTFPGNHLMWRSIHSGLVYSIFYNGIIFWEFLTALLILIGVIQLCRALRKPAAAFNSAKRVSIIALTAGSLLWLVAFLTIGGEWFLMWQSKTWNGQESAFRLFAIIGIVLILLALPDTETQP
jgi:predicted small integral membrane protein